MTEFRIIKDASALDELIAEVEEVRQDDPRIALDTEFVRERTYYPRLALVQMAWNGGLALIDPLDVDVAPLGQLIRTGPCILHAAEQDLQIFKAECGAIPEKLFDPQIAGSFLGFGTASLGNLVKELLGVHLPKGHQLADWLRRPLERSALRYAANDVAYLLDLEEALRARLRAAGREAWAEQENERLRSRDRGPSDPKAAWWRLKGKGKLNWKGRGVAQELCAWRETEARRRDRLPKTILSDMAIAAMAARPPRDERDLRRIRGIDRNMSSDRAEAMLRIIDAGVELGRDVNMPPVGPLDRAPGAVVALAQAFVGHVAKENELEAALIGNRDDIADFVRGRDGRLRDGWRWELAGKDLAALIDGEASLGVAGDGLVLHPKGA